MKIIEMWKAASRPTLSFELYPARTEKAAASLEGVIDELAALKPDFVSVTFGAGGSTREGSRQLIAKLRHEKGLDIIAYFACYGLSPEEISAVLDSYQVLGVENVLAVRGDAPREVDFTPHPDSFAHASDLVAFMRPRYDFCIGVAGYPEGHIDAPSRQRDIDFLKAKLDLGAEYVIANYFYDNAYFFDYVDRCRASGITAPILPGVMPIYSLKMMRMLAGLCGATIPAALDQALGRLDEEDRAGLQAFGIDFAVRQCQELLAAGVPGLHIYTMDRSASTVGIVNRLRSEGVL